MVLTTLELAAAAWLVGYGSIMKITGGGFLAVVLFKLMPMAVGIGLSFFAVARLMGWPV
jgi:hypothetical protein